MSNVVSEYLTLREAAQEIGVSVRTLQRHALGGKLRTTAHRGKANLVTRRDLSLYISKRGPDGQNLLRRVELAEGRAAELEQRVRTLEALLDVSTTRAVTLSDDDITAYRAKLIEILATRKRWAISDVSTMINDVARMSPETARAIGAKLLYSAMERATVEARLLRHTRSEIYAGRALLVMRELGVQPEEAEHLASDW